MKHPQLPTSPRLSTVFPDRSARAAPVSHGIHVEGRLVPICYNGPKSNGDGT